MPLVAPRARSHHSAGSRRGRFAAPPASPSPSASHSSAAAFFPHLGELGDEAGEVELRQHLVDTLMAYGMAPSSSSAGSAPSSLHRRSSRWQSHPHYAYAQQHSSSSSAAVAPVDPFDPTGLVAANDTSTLPKELPAALTALLAYIHTLAPSIASTQHARLQAITYHLQSLVSAPPSSASPATAVAAPDGVVDAAADPTTRESTAGSTPGDGEGCAP